MILNKLPKDHHFDYQYLLGLLHDYSSPRDKIGLMIRKREILRVKKGLYVLSPEWGGTTDPMVLANVMYGPSYVSLESALSFHGLLPERVTVTTSITSKRSRSFSTPLGNFTYRHIRPQAFILGVLRVERGNASFLIASPEKALCDRIARSGPLTSRREVRAFLFDDLRIHESRLENFDTEMLISISRVYGSPSVRLLTALFRHPAKGKKR